MTDALAGEFPGVDFNFSQYIEDNVEEAASGVKGENSVKLFGNDLEMLEKTADKIKDVMATVPGITDLAVLNSLGQPTVRIDVDRARAARYGLAPGDINATVQAAIGGQAAGNLYEDGSDRQLPDHRAAGAGIPAEPGGDPPHHDRRAEPERQRRRADPADRRGARCSLVSGASFIYREQQERYIPDQVQRARPRPGQRGAGGAAEGRRAGAAAGRLSPGMGRRVRQSAGGARSAWRSSCRSASC